MYPPAASCASASSVVGERTDGSCLEELHRELDVPDAAAPALHLAVREAAAVHLSLRPGLHRPHRANRVRVEDLRPDDWLHELEKATAEVAVAGDRPGLQERLELPRLRPPLVVRGVCVQRARQRSRPAFGAEVGVSAEHDAVGGGLAHRREHRAGGALGDGAVALVDEQHVDVAGVVELPTTELSHRDDPEPDVRRDEVERAAEAHLGQGRQLPGDHGKVGHPEQISRRDAQQLAPLPPTQGARAVISGREERGGRVAVLGELALAPEALVVPQRVEQRRISHDRARQRA
jgi:hypothetical protein